MIDGMRELEKRGLTLAKRDDVVGIVFTRKAIPCIAHCLTHLCVGMQWLYTTPGQVRNIIHSHGSSR